jgi:hypothetical protein
MSHHLSQPRTRAINVRHQFNSIFPSQRQLRCLSKSLVLRSSLVRPQQHLSFSPIHVIASQEPVTHHPLQGLSFAGAKAIIYGCIGFAAFRFMFNNLGEEGQIMCLVLLDTAVAVLAGRALLRVGAHMYDDRIPEVMGRTLQALLDVADNTLQTLGLIAGDILQGFRDVADEMRQGFIEDSEPLTITFVDRLE